MKKNYDAILFDLDGTITESGTGIRDCFIETLNKMNYTIPDLSDFHLFVGPPLIDTFQKLCNMDYETALKAVALYKESYDVMGRYKNKMYPNICEILINIKKANIKLGIATTKNEKIARWVLGYIGIIDLFDVICGVTDNYSVSTKEEVINNAIKFLDVLPKNVLMIGDTHFDAEGSRKCGCDFIGVLYGYGNKEKMESEGAEIFAKDSNELKNLIFSKNEIEVLK